MVCTNSNDRLGYHMGTFLTWTSTGNWLLVVPDQIWTNTTFFLSCQRQTAVERISFLRSNLELDSEVNNPIIFVKNTCESLLDLDPVSTCLTILSLFKEKQYFSLK